MPKKQLIIPHYCKKCQHLTFVVRESDPFQYNLLDFLKGTWKSHSCAQIHPGLIEDITKQDLINKLEWAPTSLNFAHQSTGQPKKRQPLTMGVILNVSGSETNVGVEVLTPENQLINVRILKHNRPVTAGRAINLKKAVRVGKDKYRLEKIESLNPGLKATMGKSTPESYYQLILKARDQEKLETFINRLIDTCNKNRILPVNVIPLPIERIEGEQIFKRELNLPLESELLRQIEKITVPESVQISVHQS